MFVSFYLNSSSAFPNKWRLFHERMYTSEYLSRQYSKWYRRFWEAIILSLKQYLKGCLKHEFQQNYCIYSIHKIDITSIDWYTSVQTHQCHFNFIHLAHWFSRLISGAKGFEQYLAKRTRMGNVRWALCLYCLHAVSHFNRKTVDIWFFLSRNRLVNGYGL